MGVAIAFAWLADRVLGDPSRFHPVAAFGALAGGLERRMWRPSRAIGALYTATLVGCAAGVVASVERRFITRPRANAAVRALVLWASLGGLSLERAALALSELIGAGRLAEARVLAPALVGRDPSALDGAELCRAAVESVAENTNDAVVAPLLWAAVLGAPGVAAYRAANTLDAMVGHRGDRHERFGWSAARLDDLASWPAARLSALLAVGLAPVVGGRPVAALGAAFRDGAAHPSPNAGRVEGAFAGALGVRLGGVNRYPHGLERRPTLGRGEPPGVGDVARAVALARAVSASAAALCILLAVGMDRWRSSC